MALPWWSWCLLTLFLVLLVHAVSCVMCLSKDVRRRVTNAEASVLPPLNSSGTGLKADPSSGSSNMMAKAFSSATTRKADSSFFTSYFQLDGGGYLDDAHEMEAVPTFHTRIPSDTLLHAKTL